MKTSQHFNDVKITFKQSHVHHTYTYTIAVNESSERWKNANIEYSNQEQNKQILATWDDISALIDIWWKI